MIFLRGRRPRAQLFRIRRPRGTRERGVRVNLQYRWGAGAGFQVVPPPGSTGGCSIHCSPLGSSRFPGSRGAPGRHQSPVECSGGHSEVRSGRFWIPKSRFGGHMGSQNQISGVPKLILWGSRFNFSNKFRNNANLVHQL